MNKLFERFILVQLHRVAPQFADRYLRVAGQVSKRFWSSKTIRPDIVVSFGDVTAPESVVLDTKWKVPSGGQPADDDLKQIYTYNLHLGARRGLLIYPRAHSLQSDSLGNFAPSSALPPEYRHSCGMCFVDLFDSTNSLRKDIGAQLAEQIFAS